MNLNYKGKNLTVKDSEGLRVNMTIPPGGAFYIGNAAKDKTQQFEGYVTCIQIYNNLLTDMQAPQSWESCLSKNWIILPPG